jgi:multiple sugar transport system substrate-binding protein
MGNIFLLKGFVKTPLSLVMILAVMSWLLMPASVQSKPVKLRIASHKVHQIVSTQGEGGDITQAWQDRTGIGVEWLTFSTNPLHERIFRETSLSETTLDVVFLLNTRAVPNVANLLEPLDEWNNLYPIEDFDDIFPGMVAAMKFNGTLYGIPFRHSTSGLHVNETFLEEQGLSGPPKTIEEFINYAKILTYTRKNGDKVVGYVGVMAYPNVVDIARAWDGDFIDLDYKCRANEAAMVRSIQVHRELYEYGAYPKAFTSFKGEDMNVWTQTGRSAMVISGMGRNRLYNDPNKSQFPGKIKTVNIPISEKLLDKYAVAPAKVEFWTMAIPRNSTNKQYAWSLIKHMLSKDATLNAALNGNGPVRNSTYQVQSFVSKKTYAKAEGDLLKVARVPLPAFNQSAKAADIFKEEAEAAVLGFKTPQEAMDSVCRRVNPLLPK